MANHKRGQRASVGPKPLPDDLATNYPGLNFTEEEWAFAKAMHEYQTQFRVRYPSWREILFVLKKLGYVKVKPSPPAPLPQGERGGRQEPGS